MNFFYTQLVEIKNSYVPLQKETELDNLKKVYPGKWGYGPINAKLMIIVPQIPDIDIYNQKLNGIIKYLSDQGLINNIYVSYFFVNGESKEEAIKRFCKELLIVNPNCLLLFGLGLWSLFFGEKCNINNFHTVEDARHKKHVVLLDKYYSCFITYDLMAIAFQRDKVIQKVKEDLDLILKEVNNGKIRNF